jgi:hypothetical protein
VIFVSFSNDATVAKQEGIVNTEQGLKKQHDRRHPIVPLPETPSTAALFRGVCIPVTGYLVIHFGRREAERGLRRSQSGP